MPNSYSLDSPGLTSPGKWTK